MRLVDNDLSQRWDSSCGTGDLASQAFCLFFTLPAREGGMAGPHCLATGFIVSPVIALDRHRDPPMAIALPWQESRHSLC